MSILLQKIIEEYNLYEGLDVTHNVETSADILNQWCSLNDNIVFKTNVAENKLKLQTRGILPTKEEFDNILKWINNLGYYPSYMLVMGKNQKFDYDSLVQSLKIAAGFEVIFEAKFDPEIGSKNIPKIAYHVTVSSKEEKILKIGLAPKSKEKISKHPARVYFAVNIENAELLAHSRRFRGDNKEFTIFEVDIGELKKRRVVRYFSDPNFPAGEAFYTYENIPPQYLKIVNRIHIN